MAIRTRDLIDVQSDLTNAATTESDFRAAIGMDLAFQVDANEEELKATKTLTFGDALTGTTTFMLTDDAITIDATINSGSVGPGDLTDNAVVEGNIMTGAVTSDKIRDGTIVSSDIATGAKERFQVRNSSGVIIFDLDGLARP